MAEFILASKSPRRKMLLRNLIDHFVVINPEVLEQENPGETPTAFVRRLAKEKALEAGTAIAQSSLGDVVIIAADTIVVDKDEILGKPRDQQDAHRILNQLNGKTHQVLSGIALYQPAEKNIQTKVVCTDVLMREYTENEIQKYINSGDPMDKAGAYAIQNRDFNPAPAFRDCYANVMGLPLCHLAVLMKEMGYKGDEMVAESCQESIHYQCPVYAGILGLDGGQSTKSKKL